MISSARTYLALILFLSGSRLPAAPSLDLYSQNIYTSREDLYSSSTRARTDLYSSSIATPFLQVGSELTQAPGQHLSNSSFGYASLGLARKWSALQAFLESRSRHYIAAEEEAQTKSSDVDHRALVVSGHFRRLNAGSELPWSGYFDESYGEALFTSADNSNLIADGFIRSGIDWRVFHQPMLAAYIEPGLAIDRLGHYYNNKALAKLVGRVQRSFGGITVSVSLARLAIAYTTREMAEEQNPYRDQHYAYEALAVIGGVL